MQMHFLITLEAAAFLLVSGSQQDLKTGLLGCWKFDTNDPKSVIAIDSSGHDRHLRIEVESGRNPWNSYQFPGRRKDSLCLHIDRDNQGAKFAWRGEHGEAINDLDFDFHKGNFTIAVWVRLSTLDGGEQVIVEKYDGGSQGWSLTKLSRKNHGHQLRFRAGKTNYDFGYKMSTNPTNIVITRSSSMLTLYINGDQEKYEIKIDSKTDFGASAEPLLVGKRFNKSDANLRALVDDLAIWDRALSPNEVMKVYQGALPK